MRPKCSELIDLLRRWYEEELATTFPNCWVFGSLVYKDGSQFTTDSDIDLVVRLPDTSSPIERVKLLDCLRASIQRLEQQLLETLSRDDASLHFTSVIPVTDKEIALDIHKSKVRDFFRSSEFFSLLTGSRSQLSDGRNSESSSIPQAIIHAIEVCQEYRNKYVACSVNGSRKVEMFDSPDPFPKVLARSAAQIADFIRTRPGTNKFDLNAGTAHILSLLQEDKLGDANAFSSLS
ncbi:MAG: nucleotidyltransferase domain-containing protein, partial [Planctomycetota bacterium]